jgi:PhzF family phenazine biosynthesis protein
MPFPCFLVDAFAEGPFTGNPAGVCLLTEGRDEAWMQNVATEMNQAETAFLLPMPGGFALRWFTPTAEVELCGHATLASAHILWETGTLEPEEVANFSTRSGVLRAKREGDGIALDFPSEPAHDVPLPPSLANALGAEPVFVGANQMDLLVELRSEAEVRALTPDLLSIGSLPYRGVIVTAASADPAYDFVSRFFAPAFGVPEDPATGSAHCCLGPYWSKRLEKDDVLGFQASRRGGTIRVAVRGERVILVGAARTVLVGQLLA